jgi:putative ATP-dependent endonuclease of OLD family
MKLSKIVINNFCSCASVALNLSEFNPIVGYNNSGKSNILRAIEWALRKSVLTAHSFFDCTQAVTVEGVIENVNLALLPGNQQNALSPYISNGSLHFRRRQDIPSCPAGQVRIDVLDPTTANWVANPNGLDTAIGVLFPEPLYIQAMEDAEEDVGKFGAKNTLGLLLKQILSNINANNAAAVTAINGALASVSSQFNGATRMAELTQFESDATTAIGAFFPGLSLNVSFTTPGIDDLFKSSAVTLSDVHGARPFTSFGHGAQRSTHMALIKLLADLTGGGAAGAGGTVMLMIDEPELYLHPQAIELLRESLLQLSQQNFQVVFSTHSPLLVGTNHALQTQMIYKDAQGRTTVRQKLASAANAFQAHPHHAEAVFSLQIATHLLFSERVLIVEGKTEQMMLPIIYKVAKGHSYAHDKGCIAPGSSSSAILPMMGILRGIGYRPQALVDLDFVFKIAVANNLISPQDVNVVACIAWFANNSAVNGFYLDAAGLPTRKGPNGAVSALRPEECYSLMATAMPIEVGHIVAALQLADIWVWPGGAIESHLGIQKNDLARISFLNTATQNGNLAHATDPQTLLNFVNWV